MSLAGMVCIGEREGKLRMETLNIGLKNTGFIFWQKKGREGVREEDYVTEVCLDKATPDVYTSLGHHHYNPFPVNGIFEKQQKLQRNHQKRSPS